MPRTNHAVSVARATKERIYWNFFAVCSACSIRFVCDDSMTRMRMRDSKMHDSEIPSNINSTQQQLLEHDGLGRFVWVSVLYWFFCFVLCSSLCVLVARMTRRLCHHETKTERQKKKKMSYTRFVHFLRFCLHFTYKLIEHRFKIIFVFNFNYLFYCCAVDASTEIDPLEMGISNKPTYDWSFDAWLLLLARGYDQMAEMKVFSLLRVAHLPND